MPDIETPAGAGATLVAEDRRMADQLLDLQVAQRTAWTQVNDSENHCLHGLFQYPAMMVPQMQHDILDVLRSDFDAPRVWDAFVGSGTTLAESMNLGLDFVGRDINPLAILICRVKAGPYHVDAFASSAQRVLDSSNSDRGRKIEVLFPNWQKWFRVDVALALSRLRRAIRDEPNAACRRFHWLALAETIRLCSNSRLSTVKLHIRPTDQIRQRKIDVYGTYRTVLARNLRRLREQRDSLLAQGLLRSGHYIRDVQLELGDIRASSTATRTPNCQILLTSPPYGDNASTVAYGQQAYLPLQWIPLVDIHPDADAATLASTHALDTMSLGGSKALAQEAVSQLATSSASLEATFSRLKPLPRDRTSRVAAFFRDLGAALPAILARLESGALMAWTVGNRHVGGASIPFDEILIQLLEAHGVHSVCRLERDIPPGRKRMATRNGHAETIGTETILVLRRG